MIYCFTGTGNSEFVAKRIEAATGFELRLVYEAIRDGVSFEPSDGETLVFVTPTHAWRVPRIVEKWVESGKKAKNCKAYFVMTCGSDTGKAEKYAKALCENAGFEFMGVGEVVMPENYVAMFSVPDTAEAKAIVKKAIPVIDGFAGNIAKGEPIPQKRAGLFDGIKSGMVNDVFYKFSVSAAAFTASDACTSCGKCARVCITHNIKLTDGKPSWGDNCIHCMRCICDCPAAAIEYGRKSVGKPRYHCPEVE